MDPSVFDPQSFDLGILLTAAGVTVGGAILASIIQIVKGFWKGLDAFEAPVNIVLSALIVGYAYFAIAVPVTPTSLFMLFLAFLNLAGATKVSHDAAPQGLRDTLSQKDAG